MKLEELKTDAQVLGIVGKEAVKIISSQMMGDACQVVFRDSQVILILKFFLEMLNR